MHPIDHTSTALVSVDRMFASWATPDSLAVVYRLFDSMISGALYHLVATSTTISKGAHFRSLMRQELTFRQFRIIGIRFPIDRMEASR